MKKALITGINGQDGSYLAEFLLEKGYEVHGILKRNSVAENQTARLDSVFKQLHLYYGDLTDLSSLIAIMQKVMPDEVYNLAAQSHVRISFDVPVYTVQADAVGVLNVFEAVKLIKPDSRIYQASSSEMFGNCIDDDGFQRETTRMLPVSPYGCAKVFAYNLARNYRHSYDMFISNGILFNHESPRRGSNFVTSKIVKGAIAIASGKATEIRMGNLDARRDWGHAKDYVEAMWLILQADKPDDFCCSTGVSHSVQDCCEYVFSKLGMDYRDYYVLDERYLRPEELEDLKGDSTKIRTELGWSPKYTFETLMDDMIESDENYPNINR
ncbi:MAG: GDP-mannose 4,6-dehydratase [Phycisphaerales bacterium]|jgi:GDPmannose 4,6-dehydratase|nr:GDP-mannose 4,6-dehydratase [Phycisphaerales bacterium]